MTGFSMRLLARDEFMKVRSLIMEQVSKEQFFTLAMDASDEELLAYWFGGQANECWAYEENGEVLGLFYLRPNHFGLGNHVANAGYVVSPRSAGKGLGRKMGEFSLKRAKERGFKAVQFNFVVSTNEVAVNLWKNLGFEIVAVLPRAFHYKRERFDDAYVMFRSLE